MQTASLSAAGVLLPAPFRGVASSSLPAEDRAIQHFYRLDNGWQFRRGDIGDISEALRTGKQDLWQPTRLPHCFNELDACDPDQPFFRGQGWYRTQLQLSNPLKEELP
jgi:beta-galactosidase